MNIINRLVIILLFVFNLFTICIAEDTICTKTIRHPSCGTETYRETYRCGFGNLFWCERDATRNQLCDIPNQQCACCYTHRCGIFNWSYCYSGCACSNVGNGQCYLYYNDDLC